MKKKLFNVFKMIILIFIILFGLFYIYTFDYYKSSKINNKYLKSNSVVSVRKYNNYYMFDGPNKDTAIIFYPGAKVEYTSYSELLNKLAYSYDVFNINMPFNLAILGSNRGNIITNKYKYKHYYIMGHSMGGVSASIYANNNKKIDGIIYLASYPSSKLRNDIKVISIKGSKDKVLNKKSYISAKKYLPSNALYYELKGGNHANYASYGKQKGDGINSISREKQINETVYLINNFIN